MAINPPSVMLKAVWMTHFVLTSWAMMSDFLPISTYWYTHVGVLAFGFWAMVAEESVDAILMFLVTMCFSIINDILCIAIYEPRGYDHHERSVYETASGRNEYRWALGMAITNLIVKPVTLFLLFRVYQSRSSGSDFNTGIPGLDRAGRRSGGYDNIDDPYPGIHGKPAGNYQEPPPSAYQSPSAPAYHSAPPPPQPAMGGQGQSEA